MKSFLPPNCLKGGMCLLHLRKSKMHTVKRLLQPHLARRVQPTIKFPRIDMPNPFTGAKKPMVAPCKPKAELGVCYMWDEPIPQKCDTIALQLVSCDACRATYQLRCAKLARVPRHGLWICESCAMMP